MTRQNFTLAVAAVLALGAGQAWAQERQAPTQDTGPTGPSAQSSRGGGGESVGRAVERSDPGPSTSSSSGSSGGSSSSSGGGGSQSWDAPSRSYDAPRRPEQAPERAAQRRGGGGSGSGERAVPRGSGGSGGGGSTSSTRGESGSGEVNDHRGRERSAVPVYARPREGRPAVGSAAERRTPINRGGGIDVYYVPSSYYYYDPYYLRSRLYSSYWLPGYGFGLGYFGYDPFYWGNYGYASGYYDPYYGGGYGGYGGSGYSTRRYETGNVRLKVKPAHAQVYVDGYFVGEVDSFDGVFQRLNVEAGSHRIELRAEGYEPVQFELLVTPGETVTYKGEMIRR